jgi:hypothetical protein
VSVPLPSETSPHTPQAVEIEVTSDIELEVSQESKMTDKPNNSTWKYKTRMDYIILPISLGVSVFACLTAVYYVTKRCNVHSPQHHITEDNTHSSTCDAVPFLKAQEVDLTNQTLGSVNRNSKNDRQDVYYVNEQIR